MERTFSQLELLQAEFGKLKNKSVIDRALYLLTQTKYVNLMVALPDEYLIRATIICEDITEAGELEKPFILPELIEILFDDFLRVIRDEENYESLYKRLTVRDEKNKQSFIINHSLIRESSEELAIQLSKLKVILKRKSALRGEIVLCDLAKIYPEHQYTLESIIELITVDFIKEYQDLKGDRGRIIKNILRRL